MQDFSWFNYSSLNGIGDECTEIFAQSELIDEKRRNALVWAIVSRANEIAQMQSVSRPKPTLSEALKDVQKKVEVQTNNVQPTKRDEC